MRITAGILRNRQIKVPAGIIRPAMEKMRESIFSILGDLKGQSFLDIFSGSGIMALEAASRGAAYIEAVEKDPLKRRTLLENVGISPVRISCRFMPAELYIKRAKRPFDFIFCDPPFNYKFKAELLESIAQSVLMNEGSTLIIHHPDENLYQKLPDNLVIKKRRDFGLSVVHFFSHKFA